MVVLDVAPHAHMSDAPRFDELSELTAPANESSNLREEQTKNCYTETELIVSQVLRYGETRHDIYKSAGLETLS